MYNKFLLTLSIIFLTLAVVLQVHNAKFFDPLHGFDGFGHIEYFEYIEKYQKIPLPHEGWQMYQSPFYYLAGYLSYKIGGLQYVQYQNVLYYLLYIVISCFLLQYLLGNRHITILITVLSLTSLPVVNYLVPMISNEFLSDTLMSVCLLNMAIFASKSKYSIRMLVFILINLVVGFYTKISILTLGPTFILSIWLVCKRNSWSNKKFIKILFISLFACFVFATPIIARNLVTYQKILPMAEDFFPFKGEVSPRNLKFFLNLSWIYKIDLFHSHYYSFIGGTWSSFWHDGYQTTVPVVEFHKKAFVLWLIGFLLMPISIIGLYFLWLRHREASVIYISYVLSAFVGYVIYNFHLPYPSELKSFFMSAIPVVYVTGVASFVKYKPKIFYFVLILLCIQFFTNFSYFWILPWWHISK